MEHYLINYISGRPEDDQDMESIQEVIDELNRALSVALKIREKCKELTPPHKNEE